MSTDEPEHIQLSTGRRLEPNFGIIGISHIGEIGEGKDGELRDSRQQGDGNFDYVEDFTAAERMELADIMLARWLAYKRRAEGEA